MILYLAIDLPGGNVVKNFFENNFETNDSDIIFIERRFDATACIIFKLHLHCVDTDRLIN
jgi:hypothetical protein